MHGVHASAAVRLLPQPPFQMFRKAQLLPKWASHACGNFGSHSDAAQLEARSDVSCACCVLLSLVMAILCRNFRSLYDDEQLETMIDIAASMRNICGRNNGGDTGQLQPARQPHTAADRQCSVVAAYTAAACAPCTHHKYAPQPPTCCRPGHPSPPQHHLNILQRAAPAARGRQMCWRQPG